MMPSSSWVRSTTRLRISVSASKIPSLVLLGQFRRGRYSSIRLVRMSSSIARNSSPSHTWRWSAARDRRRRSGRGGQTPAWSTPAPRLLLPLLPFLPDQKAIAQHDQRRMTMEAMPQPSLVLIPPQQLLRILMKAFDVVPAMHVFDHHLQRGARWEVAPVIALIATCSGLRSFADQEAAAPVALRGLAPGRHGMELGGQPAAAAFAPADGPPAPACSCCQELHRARAALSATP